MVTRIDDPATGTTWFDASDPSGTAMTWIVAVVGLGALLTALSIARGTVQPTLGGFVDRNVPMVETDQGGGFIVED